MSKALTSHRFSEFILISRIAQARTLIIARMKTGISSQSEALIIDSTDNRDL